MKTEVKKISPTKREISVEIKGDAVKNKFEEVFTRIAKEAKVPGFRPGHAPRDIIEKNFSSRAHQMVLEEMIPDTYHEAVTREGLDVVDAPEISEVNLQKEALSFKATVEILPEVELNAYRGIRIEYKKVEVSAEEVKRHIDSLKESRKADALDDRFARGLGYPSLAELEEAVKAQVEAQKYHQQRQQTENALIEKLLLGVELSPPRTLVNRQLEDLLKQAKVELALQGVPREKIAEQEKALSEKLLPQAEKQVKVYLVLAAVAKKENIALDGHMSQRVMEFLLKEADWHIVS